MFSNTFKYKSYIYIILFISIIFIPNKVNCEENLVEIQPKFFVKILGYLKDLPEEFVNVGVVFDSSSHISINTRNIIIYKLKQYPNIKITSLDLNNIQKISKKNIDVFYVSNDISSFSNIENVANKNKIVTFSSNPEIVHEGKASLSVTIKNNRPKILLNLNKVKAEGQKVSYQLIKLAEVI
ncbi:MAG: YfiR/HmsC family protein [Candidatus Sericytochromatia bacterium]